MSCVSSVDVSISLILWKHPLSNLNLHSNTTANADRYAHGYRHFNRHSASDKQPNNDSYTDGDPNGYSIAYLDADVDLYEYTLANSDCDR